MKYMYDGEGSDEDNGGDGIGFFCELYSCRMLFVLVMVMVMGVVAYKRRSHREVQLYSFIFS